MFFKEPFDIFCFILLTNILQRNSENSVKKVSETSIRIKDFNVCVKFELTS